MIRLRINSTYLPLPEKAELGFSLVTGVLNISDPIEPSFALPIEIPINEISAPAFGYSFDPGSSFDRSQIFEDCAIEFGNNELWPGALQVREINDNRALVNFRFASGFIPTVNRTQKLKDFFLETTIRIQGNTTNKHFIQWETGEKTSYKVVFNAVTYEQIQGELGSENYYLDLLAAAIGQNIDIVSCTFDSDTKIMIIQSANNTPIVSLATYNEGAAVIQPVQRISSEFQFTDLTGQGSVFELPPMFLPGLYNQQAVNYSGFANTHEIGHLYAVPEIMEDIEVALVPCIKTKWILEQIFERFGITISGSYLTDTEFSQRLEFVPRSIDKEAFEADSSAGLDITIPVSEFLPEILFSDWIQSLRAESCASLTFDTSTKTASLNLVESILTDTDFDDWDPYVIKLSEARGIEYNGMKQGFTLDQNDQELSAFAKKRELFVQDPPVTNLTALAAVVSPSNGNVRLVESKNAFYRYQQQSDLSLNWSFFAYNLDDNLADKEGREIRTKYSPLADTDQSFEGRDMRLPVADVVGFLPEIELNDQKFAPRFTIFRGTQKDLQNNDYEMASAGINLISEAAINGASIVFSPAEHPASLEVTVFAAYKKLLQSNTSFSALLKLPFLELQRLDPKRKKRMRGVNFIIESIEGSISKSGLSFVSVEIKKVD